jgi:hypothetical protein
VISARLPRWAAPAPRPSPAPTEGEGGHRAWRIETLVLVVIGLLLTAAVVNDVVRQLGIDARKKVDMRTFAHYVPGTPPKHIEVAAGQRGLPDITCGRPVIYANVRVCLIMIGSSHVLYRDVVGRYTLPFLHSDRRRYRFACAGYAVTHHLCPPGGGHYQAP